MERFDVSSHPPIECWSNGRQSGQRFSVVGAGGGVKWEGSGQWVVSDAGISICNLQFPICNFPLAPDPTERSRWAFEVSPPLPTRHCPPPTALHVLYCIDCESAALSIIRDTRRHPCERERFPLPCWRSV